MTVESAMRKARQTKTVCGLTRRGTRRGYQVRRPIEVLAHPDLATLADEIERLQAADPAARSTEDKDDVK